MKDKILLNAIDKIKGLELVDKENKKLTNLVEVDKVIEIIEWYNVQMLNEFDRILARQNEY